VPMEAVLYSSMS